MLLLQGCATDDITSEDVESQRLLVETEQISTGSIQQTLELSGQLLPRDQVPLFTGGPLEVMDIHVEIGQAVERGDLLLTLNDEEARRQVSQARQALEQLEQSLVQVNNLNRSIEQNVSNMSELEKELQQSINRSRTLLEQIQTDNFENSLAEIIQASLDVSIRQTELIQFASVQGTTGPVNTLELEMQIAQAEEAVRQSERALQATRLTSPISGVVSQLDVSVGQVAAPSIPLVTVANLVTMNATFSASSFEVNQLEPGLKTELSIMGVEETITSEVSTISPVVNPQTNSFTVQIPIDNDSMNLKGGMRATALIDLQTIEDALLIPANAVLYQDGVPYTFVVQNEEVKRQEIDLGSRSGDFFEVLSGVSKNDIVVTTGKERLTDGAEITIRSE